MMCFKCKSISCPRDKCSVQLTEEVSMCSGQPSFNQTLCGHYLLIVLDTRSIIIYTVVYSWGEPELT